MKKSGRKVLSVILTVVMLFVLLPIISLPMRAKAGTTLDGLFDYSVNGNNQVAIDCYLGTDSNVVIPKEIDGKPVCFINSSAFTNFSTSYLKNVKFEGSVESINGSAFRNCSCLERVVVEGDLGNIESYAFAGCSNLKSIEIKGNVGDIGEGAFQECRSLESLKFEGSVGNICSFAFDRNISLESIVFEGNVKKIEEAAFIDCGSIESIEFKRDSGDIGDGAFPSCENLKSLKFKGIVGNIGEYAFGSCEKLKSLEFKGNVGDIGEGAFYSCKDLEVLKFEGNVGDIGESAFSSCKNLKVLEFEGNVKNIEKGAFYFCSSLKSIKFNGSIGDIGEEAFMDSINLKTVLISSAYEIDNSVFNSSTDIIKYTDINGKKLVYNGQDLSEEVCKSIVSKMPLNDFKISFWDGEKEVVEVNNVGDYTAELLFKDYNNPGKYTSLLKTTFTVEKINICDSTVEAEISSDTFVYNAEDQNAQINNSIKLKINGSNSYLPSENYKVEFSNDGGQSFSEELICQKVGSYQAKIVAKGSNCTGEVSGINITINPKPLTITVSDASTDCDGNSLESKGYTVDGLAGNDSIKSINISGSQTGPGSSENIASDAVIVNAAGEDVTDCYDITYVKGTLTVTEHVFDKEIATDEHMASPATQNSPAKYFKSCLCGENGTETFEAGDPLPTYTITFEANGGIVDIEVNGTNEEYKLDSLPTPTYEGYDFKGWYTNAIGGTEITTDTVFGANMTIYAHWEKLEEPKPAQGGSGEEFENPKEPTEPKPTEPQEPTEPEIPEEPEVPEELEVEIPEKDWLDDLWLALHIADELGGAQTVEYSGDFALSYDIMNYLVEHPSITFVYHVTYEDVEYTIIIPAGKAVSSTKIPWYGPLWLLANYGNENNK